VMISGPDALSSTMDVCEMGGTRAMRSRAKFVVRLVLPDS